ncbi:alpha/beta hydrolase [Sphingomonas aliaeris]|uniref:Alpha/beta hydrolase n=1 Tax=Sphingomonas aliaeris TaxID=2759526 RepID=A0A974NVV2_9SPHN|nr:alpha/beta hydrolase [Sphingomonas aliaeris]
MSSTRRFTTGLLQPGWRESHRAIDGVTLHVVDAGPVDGPVVILLHGFPEFWWAWRYQIDPLAEAGYRVIVPDMRGYGESDPPQDVASYTLDTLVADVVALADAYGAERIHLVGHDWGAVIGWWLAARHPDRLRRVVLMAGPHPDVLAKQALTHPTQALRSAYVAFFQLPLLPETALGSFDFLSLRTMMQASGRSDTFEPGALDHYVEAWRHSGSLTGMLNYYRALPLRFAGGTPARISPATLILWGSDDRFLELHVAEASLDLCDTGRLQVLEGASHWLHLEQPERVASVVSGWLATT